MRGARTLAIVLIVATCFLQFAQAASPLIEVATAEETFRGRSVAHDAQVCWLMECDGRLQRIPLSRVQEFRKISPRFVPCTAVELRSRLQAEFGHQYEVKGTQHYLVCAARGHAQAYADKLEQLYREFHVYLTARNFPATRPEFPLLAIVFPTQREFAQYAHSDGIRQVTGLRGYYEPRTNRIALFDPDTSPHSAALEPQSLPAFAGESPDQLPRFLGRAGEVSESLERTLIHEATHQVAFNVGLHSRIAPTPRWVVEGLAMVFEEPDSRSAVKSNSARQRLNRERYVWFGNYAKVRRQEKSLPDFVSSDQLFRTATLDAYSEAWALTFFLLETRPSAYARYLERIAARDPLAEYPPQERRADFQSAFGSDLPHLETEFLRFINRL